MNQQRTSQRIPMELPVEIRWKSRAGSQKQATGKTGNISGSGLFIEVPIRLHRATSVSIKVMIPREAAQTPLEALVQGTSREVESPRAGSGVGCGNRRIRVAPYAADWLRGTIFTSKAIEAHREPP